jgi:Mn-dependent DtxR family transcriptional regulator
MSTPKQTHLKIQEISGKYISGKAPIYINSLADEMGINKDIVVEHLSILRVLNLIEYADQSNEVIILTESGKMANL